MEFTAEQVILIGLLATVLVFVLSTIAQQFGWKPNREQLTAGLFVVSFALAALFNPQTLPPFPGYVDPTQFSTALVAYLGALLASLAAIAGVATLIYNILLKKVLEGLTNKVFPGLAKG